MPGREIDGVIWSRTLEAVAGCDPPMLIDALGEHHDAHYRGLKHFPTFGRGWMSRLDIRKQHARDLHRNRDDASEV